MDDGGKMSTILYSADRHVEKTSPTVVFIILSKRSTTKAGCVVNLKRVMILLSARKPLGHLVR